MVEQLSPYSEIEEYGMLVWAALFHDYYPTSVASSAQVASTNLRQLTFDDDFIREFLRLINLTDRHTTTDDDWIGQIFIDADLAILGSDEETYQKNYRDLIYMEFAGYEKFAFVSGRASLMELFLERPHIYHSEPFREALEEQARSNIQKEIEELLQIGDTQIQIQNV
jgi:predicted metal-dependent HD superfamily phosphohydrolase